MVGVATAQSQPPSEDSLYSATSALIGFDSDQLRFGCAVFCTVSRGPVHHQQEYAPHSVLVAQHISRLMLS